MRIKVLLVIVHLLTKECTLTRYNLEHQKSRKQNIGHIGEKPAEIKDFPFMANLRVKIHRHIHFCGVVIIHQFWALTTAHCIEGVTNEAVQRNSLFVRSNSTYWATLYEKHYVTEIHPHEKYDEYDTSVDYDVALLRVSNPFTGLYEKPIRIAGRDQIENKILRAILDLVGCPVYDIYFSSHQYLDNSAATAIGWKLSNDNRRSDSLQYVNVKLINSILCRNIYRRLDYKVTRRTVCAVSSHTNFCDCDSGAPLIQNSKLMGIASWNHNCKSKSLPSVFVRISVFHNWILNKTGESIDTF